MARQIIVAPRGRENYPHPTPRRPFIILALVVLSMFLLFPSRAIIGKQFSPGWFEAPATIPVPYDDSPEPGKITRLRFLLLETSLKPEAVALLKKDIGPDNPLALTEFYCGEIPVSGQEELVAELQKKYPVDYLRPIKHGTFLLTWSEKEAETLRNESAAGASGSGLEPVSPSGYFYDESQARSFPQTGFFTPEGRKHWITLFNPGPENPPCLRLQLNIYPGAYPPGKEPGLDTRPPAVLDFSRTVSLPEKGWLAVGLVGPNDSAYFCCFFPDAVCQEADLALIRPRLIQKTDPLYPPEARRKGSSGTVQLEARTGPDGHVSWIRVIEARDPDLAAAAMDAVRRWVYKPPEFEGKKYPLILTVTVTFKLSPGRPLRTINQQ
ncbi:MAG: energy transducer TonB [Candidatus Saccharicenans sp.]|nr:energy transducer TonB [Candidatus Saccharicenans sp.]